MKTFKDSAAMPIPQVPLVIVRSEALCNFYSAERRAGATPLEASERMHEYAKRLDRLEEAS